MLDECKKALFKTILGIILLITGLLILFFGRSHYFGYLDTHLLATTSLFIICTLVGGVLRCLSTKLSCPSVMLL